MAVMIKRTHRTSKEARKRAKRTMMKKTAKKNQRISRKFQMMSKSLKVNKGKDLGSRPSRSILKAREPGKSAFIL